MAPRPGIVMRMNILKEKNIKWIRTQLEDFYRGIALSDGLLRK